MKNTKTCPKCHSTNLLRVKGTHNPESNNVSLGYPVYTLARVNRYICCDCGYTEEWIDSKDMENLNLCRKELQKNEKA